MTKKKSNRYVFTKQKANFDERNENKNDKK